MNTLQDLQNIPGILTLDKETTTLARNNGMQQLLYTVIDFAELTPEANAELLVNDYDTMDYSIRLNWRGGTGYTYPDMEAPNLTHAMEETRP